MKIVISGSMQFEAEMESAAKELIARGHEVVWPSVRDRGDATVVDDNVKKMLIKDYFAKIEAADMLLVMNEKKHGIEGYIGGNVLMEMAHAFAQDLDILLLHPIPDMPYTDEISGMQPILLNGDLDFLDKYGGAK